MKKIYAVLFLSLAMLLLLAGCSGNTAGTTGKTVREPATGTRTQIHPIESGQTVVYRFHMENRRQSNYKFTLTLLDENTDAGAQARNICVAAIGKGSLLWSSESDDYLFSNTNFNYNGDPEERWDTSGDAEQIWRLLSPGGLDLVESADAALTISRNEETVRVCLDIDGARAWEATQTIKNLGEETCYLYLSVEHIDLSGITFSVEGAAGWMPTGWLRVALSVLFLVVMFIIHQLAKKIGDDHVFLVDGGLALTTGGWVLSLLLFGTLLLVRSGSPISRNLYFLPLALPSDGAAFWVAAVVLGLIALGLTIFLVKLAIDDIENPVKYLLCGLALGVVHAAWYASVLFVFLSLIGQIVTLIVTILFVAVACAFIYAVLTTPHKAVITTTSVYDGYGNLIEKHEHIDYVPVDDDEKKK